MASLNPNLLQVEDFKLVVEVLDVHNDIRVIRLQHASRGPKQHVEDAAIDRGQPLLDHFSAQPLYTLGHY